MEVVTLIRIAGAVGFIVVLYIMIQRRKNRVY